MALTRINTIPGRGSAAIVRLVIGGLFGLIIAALIETAKPDDVSIWRPVCVSTLSLMVFIIWAGAGSMRRISLAMWVAIASLVVGYISWSNLTDSAASRNFPLGQDFLIFPLLFIAHELVSSADQAGKIIAPFETYFDEAWKRGVQLALAILFTLLFWGILWLGAALLGFIGFKWLEHLLKNAYFAGPITGLAFGAAVHLGDVQTKLLASVRSLILGVLAWLLPVITMIGAIFAVSLAVKGLAPLWATKAATATLLGGCVGFVLLINAAYQQGDVERQVPLVLRWSVRGAAILLLVFSVLAAWSLGLRIDQYGLSPDRVFAGLGVIIALGFGIGYSIGVFVPGRWMGAVEPINIGLAMLKCALFIAILTPIATPDRLSVNDQVARLNSGKVSVADFDWWLLNDDTGTYGKNALKALATSSNVAIATKAKAALDGKIGERPYRTFVEDGDTPDKPKATRADIAALPVVFPQGAKLPDSFLAIDFTTPNALGMGWTSCLTAKLKSTETELGCKIALIDLDKDGRAEILIREYNDLMIYSQQNDTWTKMGSIDLRNNRLDFDNGRIRAVPSKWDDLMIGEQRRSVVTFFDALSDAKITAGAAGVVVEASSLPANAPADVPQPKAPPPPSK